MKCEKCKREIIGYPAKSRYSENSLICSMCGCTEAIEIAVKYGDVSEKDAEELLKIIEEHEVKEKSNK